VSEYRAVRSTWSDPQLDLAGQDAAQVAGPAEKPSAIGGRSSASFVNQDLLPWRRRTRASSGHLGLGPAAR
jgi:hypothetical protein